MRRLLLILTLLLLGAGTAYAQKPNTKPTSGGPGGFGGPGGLPTNVANRNINSSNSRSGNPDNPQDTTANQEGEYQQNGIEHHEEIPDSVLIGSIYRFHYTPLAVKVLDLEHIRFDPTGAQYPDANDALNGNYYLGKGSAGQSCLPIFLTFGDEFGPRLQPNTNPVYRITSLSADLYQVQKTFTRLGFAGSQKKDNHLYLTHTQNINERWNFAFDYHLIRSEGVYANSGDKNHYLDFTTNYYSKDSRYQIQGGIIWQKEALDENGGITNDDLVRNNPNATQSGIPVLYTSAGSLSRSTTLFAHQSYNTVQQVYRLIQHDSLKANIVDSTKFDTIVYYDTILPAKPRMFNTGVFALDLQWNADTRRFSDSTRWNELSSTLFWTNDAYPDYIWHNPVKLSVGYTYKRILNFVSDWSWLTYSGPTARLELTPFKGTLTLHAQQLGDYGSRISGQYFLPLDSLRSHLLEISAISQTQQWDYLYQFFSRKAGLHPSKTLRLQASYRFKDILQADLFARSIDQNVWLEKSDTTLAARQADGSCWLFQARLLSRLRFGWFHYDMQQLFQYSTNQEYIRVPLLASKNSLYADLRLFHDALRAQIGLDIRYHTAFYSDTYDPATGLFYRQDEVPIGNYVMADLFVNLQIKHATIYFKAGHLNSIIEQHPNYFLLPHYPANRLGLFFGINWLFFD